LKSLFFLHVARELDADGSETLDKKKAMTMVINPNFMTSLLGQPLVTSTNLRLPTLITNHSATGLINAPIAKVKLYFTSPVTRLTSD